MTDDTIESVVPIAPATPLRPARPLWLPGLLVLLSGVVLLATYGFPDHAADLVDLWKISDGATGPAVAWLAAVLLLTLGWLTGIAAARDTTLRDAWLPVAGLTALSLVTFALVYPATAIDVYIYAARSHLLTTYGLNPSTVTPDRFWAIDPYVMYASKEWADDTSPYGPLWNVIAAPATALDGGHIEAAVLIFKAIMIVATVGTAALIHDIARRVQPRLALAATLAWLWCPIVLWEGIANAHNDVLFIMLVVAALWCWTARRDGGVLPLLGAAALLKVVAVILIPAALVAIVVRAGWGRRLLVIAGQTTVLSVATLWIAFTPFYDIGGTIDAIQSQRGVWVSSPALLVAVVKDELGYAFDWGPIYDRVSAILIVLLMIGGAIATWRKPAALPRVCYEQLFWFLLLATANLRPWYAIWLVALAAVLPLGMPMVRAGALVVGMMASYVYTSWIQNWTDPTWLERTAIIVTTMLLPVLIVTLWDAIRGLRRARSGMIDDDVQVAQGRW